MGHWVAYPTRDNLCKGEKQHTHYSVRCRACDHHRAEQCDRQCNLTLPYRLKEMFDLVEDLVILLRLLGGLACGNYWEGLEYFLGLLWMKTSTIKKCVLEVLSEILSLLVHIIDEIESSRVFGRVFGGVILDSIIDEGDLLGIRDSHFQQL